MGQEDQDGLWSQGMAADYERENYGKGLAGYVLRRSHALVEEQFPGAVHFPQVLEVGAGSGVHLGFVQHTFERYLMTDASDAMLRLMPEAPKVERERVDATHLPYPDASFDRVVAAHVLEHIYRPHEVLTEWARVLRPGGILSLVLPCDPGVLWRLGRRFGPRAAGHRRGFHYDYVMALEHVNSITNLVAIVRHHYKDLSEVWWPIRMPNVDLNLIYAVNIRK